MAYEGMIAETISINGDKNEPISAYVARPLGSGPFPGMVLLHHAPGWDEWYREATRKFAHHGYAAISHNLYHRAGEGKADDVAAKVRAEGLASGGLDLEFRRVGNTTPKCVVFSAAIHADDSRHAVVVGQRDLLRCPDHVEDCEVRGLVQHLDCGFIRFSDLAKEQGGVGNGAGDDFFQCLPGPFLECSSEISDELVQVEHGVGLHRSCRSYSNCAERSARWETKLDSAHSKARDDIA